MALWTIDRKDIDNRVAGDGVIVGAAIVANGGLKSLDDYARVLYQNQWKASNPLGTAPGIMENYTQDLLFSMERLSQNSFPLRMLKHNETLPFQTAANLTLQIAGTSLEALKESGNLFVVDRDSNKSASKRAQRYGGACTAYFYIHPKSGDFLPLAVKTNEGSNLTYTPFDSPSDWLLAKMIFNVNDFFHAQMFHLVVTHDVSEAVHQAALHTLSEKHPVKIILERLVTEEYSSRVVGEELCFNTGGHWDQLFYVDNVGCREFVTENWPTSGAFQGGYLETDLRARGLINERNEYSYRTFFTSFVNSYYVTDTILAADCELQRWFVEAMNKAKIHDFPPIEIPKKPCNRTILIDVLTHFGYIVSVVHHSLNGGDPMGSKATLPFHLNALYAPLPGVKNVTNLIPFLPPAAEAVHYIGFLASFNHPFYSSQNRTLDHAFSINTMLARLNRETQNAAEIFL